MKTLNPRSLKARLYSLFHFLNVHLDNWDRVYLCSAAPLGAEFVRDSEEAERHHHQW